MVYSYLSSDDKFSFSQFAELPWETKEGFPLKQAVAAPTNGLVLFFKQKVRLNINLLSAGWASVAMKGKRLLEQCGHVSVGCMLGQREWNLMINDAQSICVAATCWDIGEREKFLSTFFLYYSQTQAPAHAHAFFRLYETFEHNICNVVQLLKLPPVVWQNFTVQRCVGSVCDCVWK